MTLRARETFHVGNRTITAGEPVDAKDPVVKGREHLFESDVEQATAAPGEKRSVSRKPRSAK